MDIVSPTLTETKVRVREKKVGESRRNCDVVPLRSEEETIAVRNVFFLDVPAA